MQSKKKKLKAEKLLKNKPFDIQLSTLLQLKHGHFKSLFNKCVGTMNY